MAELVKKLSYWEGFGEEGSHALTPPATSTALFFRGLRLFGGLFRHDVAGFANAAGSLLVCQFL